LIFFELQQSLSRLPHVTLGFEVGDLLFEIKILRLALQFFGSRRLDLCSQGLHSIAHLAE